jgi:hypothetical protein
MEIFVTLNAAQVAVCHHSEHPFRVVVIDGANGLHHLDQDERNDTEKKKKKKMTFF